MTVSQLSKCLTIIGMPFFTAISMIGGQEAVCVYVAQSEFETVEKTVRKQGGLKDGILREAYEGTEVWHEIAKAATK